MVPTALPPPLTCSLVPAPMFRPELVVPLRMVTRAGAEMVRVVALLTAPKPEVSTALMVKLVTSFVPAEIVCGAKLSASRAAVTAAWVPLMVNTPAEFTVPPPLATRMPLAVVLGVTVTVSVWVMS